MKIHGLDIDDRVARLVVALNELPDVCTLSSCGGHEDPGRGQVGAGEFIVELDIEKTRAGWHGVEMITEAIWCSKNDLHRLELTTWWNGDSLCFELRGEDGADPDAMADEISMGRR